MSALVLEGVRHAYGAVTVVDDVSLEVGEGEFVCLLGPSGSGKTTTLRIAAGLERLQAGRIFIGGRRVADETHVLAPEARKAGVVFQDYALFPHLNVLGNVTFGLRSLPAAERRRRAGELLDLVGMAEHAAKYPHMLSGGEQQRVALAQALAPSPRLMLLDEPFAGLDARLRDQVRDDTMRALAAAGAATLMVTHDAHEAMAMADRIAIMQAGRIAQKGNATELYCAPASAFVASFIGPVNRLHARVRSGAVATALGTVAAPGFADGCAVEVLVRPEAIHLCAVGEGLAATVSAARSLGETSHVVVRLGTDAQAFDAHVAGCHPPAPGTRVGVRIDPHHSFVFALNGGPVPR